MSYFVALVDPVSRESLCFESVHYMRGANYVIGGSDQAELSITYNYGRWYRKDYAFGKNGIRSINGLSGAESISVLKNAIAGLEESKEELPEEEVNQCLEQGVSGYWMPTRENAIRPLYQLLAMAQMRPDGVWESD